MWSYRNKENEIEFYHEEETSNFEKPFRNVCLVIGIKWY